MIKFFMLGMLVLAFGCNSKKKDDEYVVPEVVTNGVYQNCENIPGQNISVRNTVLLDDYYISEVMTYFSNSNCTGTQMADERYVYSYTKSGSTYNLAIQSLNMTPPNGAMVTQSNNDRICNITNWTLNVPTSMLGIYCDGVQIDRGDGGALVVTKAGNTLSIHSDGETFNYSYIGGWNFTPQGQALSNGNYASFDGEVGVYVALNSGNFTVTYYVPGSGKVYRESGTYTSANNEMTITTTSTLPSSCGTPLGQPELQKFSLTNYSMGLQEADASGASLLEKVVFTEAEFVTAFIGGTFSQNCL